MKPVRVVAGVFGSLSLLAAAAPSAAQTTTTVRYSCDLGGVQAQLISQITPVRDQTGAWSYPFEGRVDSPTAHYVFTGQDQYAEFTELNTHERFRVQFIVQGNQLTMVVNPQGPGTSQHQCQRNG